MSPYVVGSSEVPDVDFEGRVEALSFTWTQTPKSARGVSSPGWRLSTSSSLRALSGDVPRPGGRRDWYRVSEGRDSLRRASESRLDKDPE